MFQATVIFQDSEIGYGEGEGMAYAITDALDSIDSFYASVTDAIVRIIGDDTLPVTIPLMFARKLAK